MSKKGNLPQQQQVQSKPKGYRVTWAQAARDIVIGSMNRGQLPVLGLLGLMALMVWRMPPEDVSVLTMRIVQRLEDWTLAGWALAVLVAIGWYVHARSMRKAYADECERIGSEKSRLQANAAGAKFQGSNGRR